MENLVIEHMPVGEVEAIGGFRPSVRSQTSPHPPLPLSTLNTSSLDRLTSDLCFILERGDGGGRGVDISACLI